MTDKTDTEVAIPPHLEPPWFLRPEHEDVRTCTCFCGHVFKSQARNLPCTEQCPVKMKDSHEVVKDAEGNVETKEVMVTKFLSFVNCPNCKPEDNWIKSFV